MNVRKYDNEKREREREKERKKELNKYLHIHEGGVLKLNVFCFIFLMQLLFVGWLYLFIVDNINNKYNKHTSFINF